MNHIQSIIVEENSYCGEPLGIEFYFKSLDLALLATKFTENKTPCEKCIDECMTILSKHRGVTHENNSLSCTDGSKSTKTTIT